MVFSSLGTRVTSSPTHGDLLTVPAIQLLTLSLPLPHYSAFLVSFPTWMRSFYWQIRDEVSCSHLYHFYTEVSVAIPTALPPLS